MYSTASNVPVSVNENTPENTLDFEEANTSAEAINSLCSISWLLLSKSAKLRPTNISQPVFNLTNSSPQMGRSTHLCAFPLVYKASCSQAAWTFWNHRDWFGCPSLMSLRHTNATSPHQQLIQLDHHFEITGTLAKKWSARTVNAFGSFNP